MIKTVLKWCALVVMAVLALQGLYTRFLAFQFHSMEGKVTAIESRRTYDKDLRYNMNGGQPVFLVKPEHTVTVFFMEGFRTQNPAGMYRDYLAELHEKNKVNVVVPVYGLQSSPFTLRNREWHHVEDMRTVLQIYDAYTAMLPPEHRVITMSQSFGTLPNVTILSKARRKPTLTIMQSPLNTGMEYKAGGELIYWFSKQTSWLQHVLLFSETQPAPGRETVWDIVDPQRNRQVFAQNDINPEDSSVFGYKVEQAAAYLERELVPQVTGMKVFMVWGDQDLYFSQEGYASFARQLSVNNTVKTLVLEKSGHMVLLDAGQDRLKSIYAELLAGTYPW